MACPEFMLLTFLTLRTTGFGNTRIMSVLLTSLLSEDPLVSWTTFLVVLREFLLSSPIAALALAAFLAGTPRKTRTDLKSASMSSARARRSLNLEKYNKCSSQCQQDLS